MIIATTLNKKSISIPLETFPAQIPSTPTVEQQQQHHHHHQQHQQQQQQQQQPPLPSDGIHYINRYEGDFVDKVFGKNNAISKVEKVLSITTKTRSSEHPRTFQSQACIHNETVFLSSPFVGAVKWAASDFQSCITHLIDLAEETTGCTEMVVAIDKHDEIELNTILRAFMYLGFELLNPSLYNQDSGFTLVGYEF